MVKCNFKSITTPKLGNAIEENEDNILEPSKSEIQFDTLIRFAISDGATESSFSKEWSDFLVSGYKDKVFDKDSLSDTIKKISETWQSIVSNIELPWYAQQKAQTGALQTFLGVTINREESTYNAIAIGDCSLFQIRNDELIYSFPILNFEQFDSTPKLISSIPKYQKNLEELAEYTAKEIHPNDLIIIATDAIAAWIFKKKETGDKPWQDLSTLLNYEDYKTDFTNWLNNKRREHEIKNDDVTLILINFE
ncbi:MAG: hypothetical protein R2822_29105 [Spirosomataceae bacterium]